MKKISNILKLTIFLLILFVISCGMIVGMDYLTEDKIKENHLRKEYAHIIEAGLLFESIKEVEFDNLQTGIIKVYQGLTDSNTSCYAFVVTDTNQYATMNMIIIVEIATERIVNIHVISTPDHNYDDYFGDSNFGVINTSIYDVETNFEIVSHATVSSISIKNCLLHVQKQLALVDNKIIFKELKQRLPEYTYFEYTFSQDNKDMILLLEYNSGTKSFKYIETLIGSDLTEEQINSCVALANINLPTDWIKTVFTDASGTKLTIATSSGFKGEIVAEVKIMGQQIVAFEVKSSTENYQKNPNYTYNGVLEKYLFEQYTLGIKDTIVTGATVTSKAINYILQLADNYIASIGGAN